MVMAKLFIIFMRRPRKHFIEIDKKRNLVPLLNVFIELILFKKF